MPTDHVLPGMEVLADKRVLAGLEANGTVAVIPPTRNHVVPHEDDQALCQARHLIENVFQKLKPFRAIATRYDTLVCHFLREYIWRLHASCSSDDTH